MKDNFNSSSFQVKEFIEGFIWKDMKYLLEDMRDDIRNKLETENEIEEIYRFQGRADVVLLMLNLPETLLNNLEMEADKKVELPDEPKEDLDDMFDLDI